MNDLIVGYTQGTYDMFHIGHLNLLRNARSRCDRLVVGVNSDALVEQYKGKKVIVPMAERMEILAELRCVDQVVVCETLDKVAMFRQMRFDRLFIGDDWRGNPRWVETERQMKELGVELIFLPYTKNTSSTLLREKLAGL